MQFKNKKVLLTGGTGGIGAPLTQQIIANGGHLTIITRHKENVSGVETIEGDLSDAAGIEAVCEKIAAEDWDIVINLAGIQYFGPFEAQPADSLYKTYMINLIAPTRIIATVLPKMKAKNSGHIVNVGSIFGSINFGHFVTYSSSKSGLRGLSQALRRELKSTGIKTTYIAPRAVKTTMNSSQVLKYADLTKMSMDDPIYIASRIVEAVEEDAKDVYIGFPEAFFVRLNSILPSLVDEALSEKDRKAKSLFV